MPRYSYACDKCGHELEETRKVEDRDKTFKCGMTHEGKPCLGTYHKTIALTAPAKFVGTGWTPKHF